MSNIEELPDRIAQRRKTAAAVNPVEYAANDPTRRGDVRPGVYRSKVDRPESNPVANTVALDARR